MVVIAVIRGLLGLFLLLLLVRLVMSYVFMFARDWRPSGWSAAALEVVYSATDPPLKAVRRVIPPLRLGAVALDLAFMVVFFVVLAVFSALGTAP